ncbi:MAG: SPASM domain-containing protein, partial [Brevinema sp.]
MLFVLIDTISEDLAQKYTPELQKIHQILLHKLLTHDVLVIGNEDSIVASHQFKNAKSAYEFLAKQDSDLLIIDAYAAFLSLKESLRIYDYTKKRRYDLCLIENIPLGLVPYVIDKDFAKELPELLDEKILLSSDVKNLMNWEYQGIDVGVFLTHNKTVLRRIDFLPKNQASIAYMLEFCEHADLCLDDVDQFISKHPVLLRNDPAYIAIELEGQTDHFYARDFSSKQSMRPVLFENIITQINDNAPEALISLGIWGEPFANNDFETLFDLLGNQTVLVESKCLVLDQQRCKKVLSRPNTILIFDVTFSTDETFKAHKSNPHTLTKIKQFIRSLPNKESIWIRLTRSPESEDHIKSFLKEWEDFAPRIVITKTDSLLGGHVVDLSPIKRHSCLALRREMTILSDGTVLRCRQSNLEEALGSLESETLKDIWEKNHRFFID